MLKYHHFPASYSARLPPIKLYLSYKYKTLNLYNLNFQFIFPKLHPDGQLSTRVVLL